MRTFLAFKYDSIISEEEFTAAVNRVRYHYYESLEDDVKISEKIVRHKNIGAIIFDLADSPLQWEDFYEDEEGYLITYAPPSNWKKYCKSEDVKLGPSELLSYLRNNKDENHQFSEPACFATIEKKTEEMNIFTDVIGFLRLYEYQGKNGTFWSNRAGALPLFSGEKAELNKEGWAGLASVGWFIDNTSPIDKVMRVKQGITIKVNTDIEKPRVHFDYGAFSSIVSQRPQQELDFEAIADDMKFTLDSYQALWEIPFTVDLSGGKDSRICSAAVISAGIDNVKFRTVANYDDELAVASELLEKVGLQDKHMIVNPTSDLGKKENILNKRPIKERMRLYFHTTDGDCTPAVVQNDISTKALYKSSKKLKVAGVLGGVAKPVYFNNEKQLEKLKKLKNDAALIRLKQSHLKYDAVTDKAENIGIELMASSLQNGKNLGLHNLRLLDYFSIADNGRRWPPQGNRIDSFAVFFSNEFLKQSMNMSLSERMDSKFFSGITKYLVPEWEDARYFKLSSDTDDRSNKKMRLWQTSDKEDIEEMLRSPKLWNEYFEEKKLIQLWEDAKIDNLGIYTNAIEKLFYRVMMISNFHSHINRLNSNLYN